MPAILQNYQPVTAERLLKPEDGNWPMIRRTYDGWGYSPLDQITPANVAQLKLVWSSTTGEGRAHEAAPVVNNGVMFITTPFNQVIAFDGTTGTILWRYRRPRPQGAIVPHEVNRGVALYGDKVYVCAGEAVLVALDAKTGTEVWTTTIADNKSGYYTHARSADRRRKGLGGMLGRRIRDPRLRGGVRCRDRQGGSGARSPCPRQASRAAKPGRQAATSGRPAALRCGSPGTTIPKPTWRFSAPATAAPPSATIVPATISTPRRPSLSTSPPARSRAIINTIRTIRGITTKCRRPSWSTTSATGGPSRG